MGAKVQTLELLLLLPLPSLGSLILRIMLCVLRAGFLFAKTLLQPHHGGKRGDAHLPPRIRLRDCGAWSSALPRNSNLKKTAIPPPHMRGLELHAPTRKKAAQPPLVTTCRG